jgi:hypothetical protein
MDDIKPPGVVPGEEVTCWCAHPNLTETIPLTVCPCLESRRACVYSQAVASQSLHCTGPCPRSWKADGRTTNRPIRNSV